MNVNNKVQILPRWAVKLIGIFVPILREMYEMLYQYDRDYYFDSSKFNNYFNYKPITNLKAVQETIAELRKNEFTVKSK
jgi:nucleoside-diphosphate-sugar epimerase